MLESWNVGKLESWKVGMLECWNVGKLESWKVGKLEGREAQKLESCVQKFGKLEIGKVRSRKFESVCRFSSCPRKSVCCRYLPVKIGKCRRMGGGSIYIYIYFFSLFIYMHMVLLQHAS